MEATYNKLYANAYLSGTAKTGLLNAKVTLFGAIDNLFSSINAAIADGKTTLAEKNDVDSRFAAFNNALSSFYTAVETANQTIQDTLKGYSDTAYRKGQDALSRAEAASNEANRAQDSATTAQGIADSKAQIFYSRTTPSGGKENDLWVNGVNIYRFNGRTWEFHSLYDAETRINRGLITTGAVAVGPNGVATGGIAGSGSIRIWAGGGCNEFGVPLNPTFQVDADGNVYAGGSMTATNEIKLRNNMAGITGLGEYVVGSDEDPIRFWAGNSDSKEAPFRVTQSGELTASKCNFTGGMIAGFTIKGNQIIAQNTIQPGSKFYLSTTGGITLEESSKKYCHIGLRALDPASGGTTMSHWCNTDNVDGNYSREIIRLSIGKARFPKTPQIWLNCRHGDDGWGSQFRVESRYFHDANFMERTVINVGALARRPHAEQLASGGTWRQVLVNDVTGYLAYED